MKALIVPVADKKNFEVGLFVLMFQLATPGAQFRLQGDHMNKLGKDIQDDVTY